MRIVHQIIHRIMKIYQMTKKQEPKVEMLDFSDTESVEIESVEIEVV